MVVFSYFIFCLNATTIQLRFISRVVYSPEQKYFNKTKIKCNYLKLELILWLRVFLSLSLCSFQLNSLFRTQIQIQTMHELMFFNFNLLQIRVCVGLLLLLFFFQQFLVFVCARKSVFMKFYHKMLFTCLFSSRCFVFLFESDYFFFLITLLLLFFLLHSLVTIQ